MNDDGGTPEERAAHLLRQMTVEEKAQQVVGILPVNLLGLDGVLEAQADGVIGQGIGHVGMLTGFINRSAAHLAKAVNSIQRYLVTRTRLGIPALFHAEGLNGVVAAECTIFPTAIALAATWNPAGVEEMAGIVARQARAIGHPYVLSPVMDVARDARWGRVHETYGEDPYLASAMSVAYVRGLQGRDLRESAIATGKHFLGYSATLGGQNMAATTVPARELYEVYARPFEAAIKVAGLGAIMNSYSSVDGVPAGASGDVLGTLLRERMGFAGTVVSDYDTITHLVHRTGVARDATEAGAIALAAGIDVELPVAFGYGATLAKAVRDGVVREELLDDAVHRVLRDKFALGLFDEPYVDEDPVVVTAAVREGGELAATLARKSITLLGNDGILPLSRSTARIAVIGPHAESAALGFPPYTYPALREMFIARVTGDAVPIPGTQDMAGEAEPEAQALLREEFGHLFQVPVEDYVRQTYGAVPLAEAIRRAVPGAQVVAVAGCDITDSQSTDIPAAVAAARDADVVILALGGRPGWFILRSTEGEGCDTSDIDLPKVQVDLVKAVAGTGTPCVGVVYSGRPMALTDIVDDVSALVYAYYGGQAAADAMAAVLFGDENPGGKLPVSIPRHTGQVPIYSGQHRGSGYRRSDRDAHQGYSDQLSTPLYAFGHGLSFTKFDYSDLVVSDAEVDGNGEVTIAVTIRNTGRRDGEEIVQLYFSDHATGVTRPAQELVGFARVPIAAGDATVVEFTVAMSQLGYIGVDGECVLEPGPIRVLVGASSDDIRLRGEFAVTGETVSLEGRRSYLSATKVSALLDAPHAAS